jgi:hypothetical protein
MSTQITVFGRDKFCDMITANAFKDGELLLFGAQKSGTDKILEWAAKRWRGCAEKGVTRLPVLVNLDGAKGKNLESDEELCKYLVKESKLAFEHSKITLPTNITCDSDGPDCAWFFKHFQAIGEVQPGFEVLLLVHPVDRILANDKLKQFFRNLDHAIKHSPTFVKVAVILSGGCKLHSACVAQQDHALAEIVQRECVGNLELSAVQEWVKSECGLPFVSWSKFVHEQTGGQPWLVEKMLLALKEVSPGKNDVDAREKIRIAIEPVVHTQIQNWLKEFSQDARKVISFLRGQGGITQSEAAAQLGIDPNDNRVSHAMMECVCSGIANFGPGQRSLIKVNLLFWSAMGEERTTGTAKTGIEKSTQPNLLPIQFDWEKGRLFRGDDCWEVPTQWVDIFRLLCLRDAQDILVAKAPRFRVCGAFLLGKGTADSAGNGIQGQLREFEGRVKKKFKGDFDKAVYEEAGQGKRGFNDHVRSAVKKGESIRHLQVNGDDLLESYSSQNDKGYRLGAAFRPKDALRGDPDSAGLKSWKDRLSQVTCDLDKLGKKYGASSSQIEEPFKDSEIISDMTAAGHRPRVGKQA